MTTSTAWLRIYDAMCVIVGLTNDLFSIKREMVITRNITVCLGRD